MSAPQQSAMSIALAERWLIMLTFLFMHSTTAKLQSKRDSDARV